MYKTILFAGLLGLATPSWAALDGELDDLRSRGNIRISLAILPSLQISVVNQINIDIDNINIDSNFSEYVCITGHERGRYNLIATGGSGDFLLYNDDHGELPYSVFYKGDPNQSDFDELNHGVPSPTYEILPNQSQCTSDYNFKVTFRSEHLKIVKSGLYSGTLTLLVSPV